MKNEQMKPVTPLPKGQMFVLLCLIFTEGISGSIILPFVAFMIESFGYDKRDVGNYSGLLTSSFFAAQFVSSLFIGWISDKTGRRIVLLISLFGNTVSILMFGFSFNVVWAMFSRSLNGLLNGSTGTVKTYIREITDETNQARAYSIRSAGYAIGMAIGPVIGGFLADPAEKKYLSLIFRKDGLFGEFPYLLPCLITAIINIVGFVMGYFFLEESLNNKKLYSVDRLEGNITAANTNHAEELILDNTSPENKTIDNLDNNSNSTNQETEQGADVELQDLRLKIESHGSTDNENLFHIKDQNEPNEISGDDMENLQSQESLNDTSTVGDHENGMDEDVDPSAISIMCSNSDENQISQEITANDLEMKELKNELEGEKKGIYILTEEIPYPEPHFVENKSWVIYCLDWLKKYKEVIITVTLYAGVSFCWLIFQETMAIWAPQLHYNGIEFSDFEIGIVVSIGSLLMLVFQIFIYPELDSRIGSLNTLRCASFLWIPTLFVFPYCTYLFYHRDLLWVSVVLLNAAICILGTCNMAAVNLLINNAAPSESIGTVNGLGSSVSALARLVAPVLGGSLYSWSIQRNRKYPFDSSLSYSFMAFCATLLFISTFSLDQSINSRISTL